METMASAKLASCIPDPAQICAPPMPVHEVGVSKMMHIFDHNLLTLCYSIFHLT